MLQTAIDRLQAPDLRVLRLSPVYETEPVEAPAQPWFLNLVAEAETELPPMDLLARTGGIERDMGRRRGTPKGPRAIDIDLLFYGRVQLATPELVLPHPRLAGRRFVLLPMAGLAPRFRDPATGRTINQLLRETGGQAVRKSAFAPVLRRYA
jgi:2-amino-4-hydroxy-6-hydroxymethyldihydropteridine diphosphokinase